MTPLDKLRDRHGGEHQVLERAQRDHLVEPVDELVKHTTHATNYIEMLSAHALVPSLQHFAFGSV